MTTTSKTTNHPEAIGQRLQDAGERLVEIKDDVANNLGRRVDSVGALIRKHPIAAMGIGFGIGYLIARLLHR
jgi:ElaB/YqjD/DUF883 family membrane-anchored ribosome-binding protein